MSFLRLTVFLVCTGLAGWGALAQEPEQPTSVPRGDSPPWAQTPMGPPKLPVQEVAGPKQLLDLLNIDSSFLDRFADGRPLHADEYETLYRILYRIPRFERDELLRWRLKDVTWEEIVANPGDYRATSVRLNGRVQRIEKEAVLPEVARLLEFDHFYRVSFDVDQTSVPALVCSRWLPRAWKVGEDVDYAASVDGLLLKVGQTDDGQSQLLVVCDRVAWHPDQPNAELGVMQDHVLLASLGVDIGQFDRILDRRAITALEREPFYQMLDAASRVDPQALRRNASTEAELASLLQKPRDTRGQVYALSGQARRVQKIRVGESDIQERFGIDHYYEIDVFVPLENQVIRMGEGEDAPVFNNYFPVIFCVAELPEGVEPDEIVERQVRVPAFYFKLWAYETEFMKRHGGRDTQLSPMLIGRVPELLPEPSMDLGILGSAAAVVFVAGLGLAWLWVWTTGRKDAAVERQDRERRYQLDQPPPLDQLEASSGPDFSGLKEEGLKEDELKGDEPEDEPKE